MMLQGTEGPTTSSPSWTRQEVDIELADVGADSHEANNNNDEDNNDFDDDIGSNTVNNNEQQEQPPPPETTMTTTTAPTSTMILSDEEIIQRKRACYKKSIFAVLLLGIIAFIIADSLTNGHVRGALTTFLEWIEANPGAGIVAFILVYFVATVLFIPGSILTLGAGFVFSSAFGLGLGVCLGTLAVFVGASAGAVVSFLFGRYLFRDAVVRNLSKRYSVFEALDVALAEKGFRIMTLLRLSPIVPFNLLNYIAGVTAIPFWSYFWANFGILPGTVLYVFLGASAGSLTDSANSGDDNMTVTVVVIVVGVVLGILAIAVTSYYARKELNKVVAKRQAEMDASAAQQLVVEQDQHEEQYLEQEQQHHSDVEMGRTADGTTVGVVTNQ